MDTLNKLKDMFKRWIVGPPLPAPPVTRTYNVRVHLMDGTSRDVSYLEKPYWYMDSWIYWQEPADYAARAVKKGFWHGQTFWSPEFIRKAEVLETTYE